MLVYTIKRGDTLWQIAKEYRITLDALLAANPHIFDPNYVVPGVRINVPRLTETPPEEEMIPEPRPIWEPMTSPELITIPEPRPLREPMTPPELITIPEPRPIPEPLPIPEPPERFIEDRAAEQESARPCIYITKGGETLYSISAEWAIPLAQLHYHNYQYAQNAQLPGGERIILPLEHEYRIDAEAYTQPRQMRGRRRG